MTQFICKGVKQINNRISLNMTFTFTIRISQRFSSAREFQMGNFQKYWSQNVGQDFFVLDFFHGRKILKVDGRDGRDPQNREKNAPAGRFTCMVTPSLVCCIVYMYIFYWSLFVFFFWLMYCLSFYLQLLIVPLIFFKTFLHPLTMSDMNKNPHTNTTVI